MKTAILIDANHLLSRTFHIPSFQTLSAVVDDKTVLTGATYGFLMSLKIMATTYKKNADDILMVIWDGGGKNFRHELDANYKATRTPKTPEFIFQIQLTQEALRYLGVAQCQIHGTEADDIIGVMAKRARAKDFDVLIISGDKDFNQLVTNHVHILNPKGHNEYEMMTPVSVEEKYGIKPELFTDWLALTGDSTDNIGGIEGVGKKTATQLIQCNGPIENILKATVHYKFAKNGSKKEISEDLQQKINAAKEKLALARKLVQIKTEFDFDIDVDYNTMDIHQLKALFKKYQFNSYLREINEFITAFS
ncbi:MAG: 5'-3' exonuclease H3TH domain-containing protein [Nitrosarchaeum sp.]|nr:5'-3' exonuclease H3TH domain-containing protein [Nitrosarchaeum sp.]